MSKQKKKNPQNKFQPKGPAPVLKQPIPKTIKPDNKKTWIFAGAVILITLIVYIPSLSNDWIVNWDDGGYIHEHELVHELSWDNFTTIFNPATFYKGNYHPLTTFFYAVEYSIVGEKPFFYHLNNLIFHLLNVFLVFYFLRRITGKTWLSAFTALMFGIHPMHVESVAWVSERKDVLYTFFFLLSLNAYFSYLTLKENMRKNYILALVFFFLSLLSKSAAVALPVAMLLLDYFMKRKKLIKLIIEKIPFFALAAAFGVLAVLSQGKQDAIQDLAPLYSWYERVFIVCHNLVIYWYKCFVPVELSVMYAYPNHDGGLLSTFYYISAAIVFSVGVIFFAIRKKGRQYLFGILFFLANIVLVLQILPVGGAALSERYTYIPYIGLFFIFGWMYDRAVSGKDRLQTQLRPLFHLIVAGFVIFFSILSWQRIKLWKNGETLFTDLIRLNPNLPFGYNNRGFLYYRWLKQYDKSEADYSKAISIDSTYYQALSNRGVLYYNTDRVTQAISDFTKALKYKPDTPDALIGRANSYSTLKDFQSALPDYDRYLLVKKDHAKAWMWRGTAKLNLTMTDEAIIDFNQCLVLDPADDEAYYWKGIAFFRKEQYKEALDLLNKSLELNPQRGEVYSWRGLTKYKLGMIKESIDDYTLAIQFNPNDAAAFLNRSVSHYDLGNYPQAWDDINKAGQMGYALDKSFFLKVMSASGNGTL